MAAGLQLCGARAGDDARIDALLALPPRRLGMRVVTPERLHIGERGANGRSSQPRGHRRTTRLERCVEQRGDVEPAGDVAADPVRRRRAGSRFPLAPAAPAGRSRSIALAALDAGRCGSLHHRGASRSTRTIDVLPNVRGVHGATLQFFAQDAIYGMKTQRQQGEGTEFEALREYMPGLDSRAIDWKHSARHHKLLCKEFRTERNHQIILAFDTGYLMREPVDGVTKLDHAINAALLLAWVSLQGGDLVGTFGFDAKVRQFLGPQRGISSFARIQRATAELDYHHQETNFTLGLAELGIRLKRRALVILFTDFVDTVTAELLIESLQRIANRHVVVFVTQRGSVLQDAVDAPPREFADVVQAVIAHDFLRERNVVFERLQRIGVHCLNVPSSRLAVDLINRYLLIKQRGLI